MADDAQKLAEIAARSLISHAMDSGRPVYALGCLVGYLQTFGNEQQKKLGDEIDVVVKTFVEKVQK